MVHGFHGNGAAYAMRTVQRSAQLYFQAISQRLSIAAVDEHAQDRDGP